VNDALDLHSWAGLQVFPGQFEDSFFLCLGQRLSGRFFAHRSHQAGMDQHCHPGGAPIDEQVSVVRSRATKHLRPGRVQWRCL
jgi:hypothetical protein